MSTVHDVRDLLRAAYGVLPENAGRHSQPFQAVVAAVLAQQSDGGKVALALDRLREANALEAAAFLALDSEELEELVRPAGHASAKVQRLRKIIQYVRDQHGGSFETWLSQTREALRDEMLSLNGIGPETADRIALEAAGLPALPIGPAAHRVWKRHGWIEAEADYLALQEQIEGALPSELAAFQEFYALLTHVGAEHCRAQPQCNGCPLAPLLPPGGPES